MKPTCIELVKPTFLEYDVDFDRFHHLHPSGYRLITNWFSRAWRRIGDAPATSFDPFIYTWIAFNGWASCVTGLEIDAKWCKALSISPELCERFDELANNPATSLHGHLQQFYTLWPIFKASEIRTKSAFSFNTHHRPEMVDYFFSAGIENFEPKCWQIHKQKGEPVPLDWPHTLAVLYRVRCNLFHGEKGVDSEMDVKIVHLSFQVLARFLKEINWMQSSRS